MIRPKNEAEDLLLSITKKCETLIEQFHKKPGETMEFKMVKPTETFHSIPPIINKGDWMLGLTSLEVCNSIFNTTGKNNKIELYTGFLYNELSYTTLQDKIAEVLGLSVISSEDLENEILGRDIIIIY